MLVWLLEHSYLLDRRLEGFCDHPETFFLDSYEVDQDTGFTEGFFTPDA